MLSDDELVEQILLGNENAAEELIKRYYTSILRYCRWHCSNLEKAEDLTQETFLKLFKNLSGYKGKKKFKAYLYTIANHLYKTYDFGEICNAFIDDLIRLMENSIKNEQGNF